MSLQLSYDQNAAEKQLQNDLKNLDMPSSPQSLSRQLQQRDDYQLSDRDFTSQNQQQHHYQRENNRMQHQLQSHEREQHLRELASLSNLLLDIPSSPTTPASTFNAAPEFNYPPTIREYSNNRAKSASTASLDSKIHFLSIFVEFLYELFII